MVPMIDPRHRVVLVTRSVARIMPLISLSLCLSVTACQTIESKPASSPARAAPVKNVVREQGANSDPTAIHLHDLAGQLLLFHFKHGRLPLKLSELESTDGDGSASRVGLSDPATGQAYAYSPDSQAHAGLNGRVVVYQSVPTSSAGRWALLVSQGPDVDRLILYVACVPEPLLGAATRP
jgi:hypothetical protein